MERKTSVAHLGYILGTPGEPLCMDIEQAIYMLFIKKIVWIGNIIRPRFPGTACGPRIDGRASEVRKGNTLCTSWIYLEHWACIHGQVDEVLKGKHPLHILDTRWDTGLCVDGRVGEVRKGKHRLCILDTSGVHLGGRKRWASGKLDGPWYWAPKGYLMNWCAVSN